MQQILYLEIPTPDTQVVTEWLQKQWQPCQGNKVITPDGIRLQTSSETTQAPKKIPESELSIFLWSLQRTTYLKVFRWGTKPFINESKVKQQLVKDLRNQFPQKYPEPPAVDLSQESIFTALAPYYPKTVEFFQKIPNGEYDLRRAYWWEKRWRDSVKNPQQPKQVIFPQ